MSVATFTKSGTKATTPAKLDKKVFGIKAENHELLKQAYMTYLANGRDNLAITKKRGQVSGGGKKPWRQKGTGRARFGSSRNPIWRGGGIAFGPTGLENYTSKLSLKAKRQALRQALSLAADNDQIIVLDKFENKEGKTKQTVMLLKKIGANNSVLLVVDNKDSDIERATRNITQLNVVQAMYLNVFDIMNADHIVVTTEALTMVNEWLGTEAESKGKEQPEPRIHSARRAMRKTVGLSHKTGGRN